MHVQRCLFLCVLILAALFYAGCEASSPVALDDLPTTHNRLEQGMPFSVLTPQAIEDEYIVVFKESISPFEVGTLARQLADANGAEVLFVYRHVLKGFAARMPATAANAVAAHDAVAHLEQSQVVYGNSVAVADTQFSPPWGLDRIDQRELPLNNKYGYSLSGNGVTAWIIDSGMDLDHTEFEGRASLGADLVNAPDVGEDCNGHGTHVAGIVGAATYGVAKDVALKAVRVFDCDNAGTVPGVIAGLDTTVALASAPSVVNLSMIGVVSSALETAVNNTVAAGLSVAVSAGDLNEDSCTKAPGSAADALTVAGSTMSDQRTATSDFGECVDLFAPGEDVTSTWLGGTTNTLTGTSQAAPHVAGVAALYLEAEPGAPPFDTEASVTDVILSHATFGAISNPGPDTPNFLLFSDVPDNPRLFDLELTSTRIKNNGKGEAVFSWDTASINGNDLDFYVDEDPDGSPAKNVANDGMATLKFNDPILDGPFEVQACEGGSTLLCSNVIEVEFFHFKLKLKDHFINQNNKAVSDLKWKKGDVSTNKIDIYVDNDPPDGNFLVRTKNDGRYKLKIALPDDTAVPEDSIFAIRACEKNSETICSNLIIADFTDVEVLFEANPDEEEPTVTEYGGGSN